MNSDWSLLQTLIFVVTPYFLILALVTKNDDDEDNDGGPGMMVPATVTR